MNDAKTAQAAYAAGWDAALTSLAKRLGAVEKEQTQDDQRQRTEELPGIPADTATSGG